MGLLDTANGFNNGVSKFASAISQALGSVPESSGSEGSGGRGTDSTPSNNLVENPFFTGLRDIGSYVPILGPAISTVGAFGNYALTGEQSSPEGATSRAKDVVENQEYVADPWALAMPTTDDVRSSMDDEQFDWYQRQFTPSMESLVTELAAGPIGSVLARGLARPTAKAAGELVGKNGSKLVGGVERAVNKSDNAIEAANKAARKEGKPKATFDEFLETIPEEARGFMGPIKEQTPKGFTEAYMDALPKEVKDWVESNVKYGSRSGKIAGAEEAAKTVPKLNKLNTEIKNLEMLGKGFGEAIPRLLRPLLDETDGMLDIGGLAYTSANMDDSDKTATVYGVPVDELNRMYEYEIYNKAMEDKAYRDAFVNRYGDTFNNFAAYGNLGNDLDYNSNRRDVTRDIFGLNDEGLNDLEIQGLKDIYFENGTINEDMTNDEMLDAILNYHWGADNIINPNQWMNNSDYQAAHALMGPDIAKQYWDYWVDNGYLGLDDTGNAFSGLGNDWDKLDMKDLSAYINAGNLINLANEYGYVPTDADMEKISDVFGEAGDKSRFTWMPEGAGTKEMNGRTYSPQEWNPGSLNYSSEEILNALINAQAYGDYSGLNPYFGFGDPLIHSNMTDAVASALEKSSNGKKVGRG